MTITQRESPLDPTRAGSRPSYPGLNLVRLALASLVLFSHAFPAFGLPEPLVLGRSLGGWAVMGFFAVSGYLIAQSRQRLSWTVFLSHRLARLLPAYWVCLLLTAATATLVMSAPVLGGDGSLTYVVRNAGLVQVQPHIAETLGAVPYPATWNASAWTLPHEFLCYVLLGGAWSVLTRSATNPRSLVLGLWLSTILLQVSLPHVGVDSPLLKQFSLLAPLFFGGAVVAVAGLERMCRSVHLPWLVAGPVVVVAVEPRFGPGLVAPMVALALLTAGRWNGPGLVRRHDISYGVYLYAFPVSQVLVSAWPGSRGFVPYLVVVTATTALLGVASWLFVERPAQRWVKTRTAA